jgi:uncharacterized integral membrane protein (TIGR02327 family)
MNPYIRLALYFVNFAISMYALSAINFNKLIYPNKTMQTQILLILCSMALSYLATQFLLGLDLSF